MIRVVLAGFMAAALAAAQGAAPQRSFVGTISGLNTETGELQVKPDSREALSIKLVAETLFQRIAPGEKDLKSATAVQVSSLRTGDRVLVTMFPDSPNARRIIVMSAEDITKRDQQDRQDWVKRGVAGVVVAKNGNEIVLKKRSFKGEATSTVTVTDRTSYRRYAPDSVKFADAKPSSLAEVRPGDQLRARGAKSEDGNKVTAEEVVFGSFQTIAGTITAVDPASKQLTVTQMLTNKPVRVRLTADTQIKRLPSFPGMPPGGSPGAGSGPPAMPPGGQAGGFAGPPGGPGRAGGPPDIAQMIERMPATNLDEFKAGDTIVISSTKGDREDSITAIMLVGNAGMLVRMATAQAAGQGVRGMRPDGAGAGMSSNGMGMPGLGGGLGGLDLGGIMP